MILSPEELRVVLRNDFMSFVERSFYVLNPPPFVTAPHIELIAAKLEACRLGKIKRLIINLPPRNLKSHCASVCFPAWILGHDPAAHVICASYGQELAEKFARDTQQLMSDPFYQRLFPTRLAGRQAVYDFGTNRGGTRMATSVGGPLTGRGGDFIIIDDPQKPDEALSKTQREGVKLWFSNTVLSRLNNKTTGCIIIIMQRLHQDDLVGYVQEMDQWDVLTFPAIAETDEVHRIDSPLGSRLFWRKAGEALHPDREPLETLMKLHREIGEYDFSSQYQQNPVPPGGALVKTEWLNFYEPGSEPANCTVMHSWDTANKSGELNDFSVCTTWAIHRKDFYLLDVFRKRLNYPDLKRAVVEQYMLFRRGTIIIEDKASGTQLIQELKREGRPVKPYEPPTGSDKIMRMHTQSIQFENGHVFLPKHARWLSDYVAEITGFPGTKFDDQVDSTTQFLDYIQRPTSRPLVITPEAIEAISRPVFRRRF